MTRKSRPPVVATVRCEILDASMLPPITATGVHIVCPIVAPTATPIAFLCVARAIVARKFKIKASKNMGVRNLEKDRLKAAFPCPASSFSSTSSISFFCESPCNVEKSKTEEEDKQL